MRNIYLATSWNKIRLFDYLVILFHSMFILFQVTHFLFMAYIFVKKNNDHGQFNENKMRFKGALGNI